MSKEHGFNPQNYPCAICLEKNAEIERLSADIGNLRNTITSMQLSLKSDGERIAKLEAKLAAMTDSRGWWRLKGLEAKDE